MEILKGHKNIAFCLSGGKDSLAALHMVRDCWDNITVVWCNTGSAFPETIEQMEYIKSIVPKFVEVRSDNKKDIYENGMPVDILPYTNTADNEIFSGESNPRFRLFYDCCRNNIWEPTYKKIKELGCTMIIRGQKDSDTKKAPIKSGEWFDGIQYFFPLEDLSDDDVYKYITENNIPLPKNYKYMDTSLDCWNCTAYLFENVGKFEYMKLHHPQLFEKLTADVRVIKEATKHPLKYIDRVLEYVNI